MTHISMTHSRIDRRLAGTTALLATAACLHAEIVVNEYYDGTQFSYVVYDMPDFDQQRRFDLPNNGVCFCGPTSTADLLAYTATHGFPDVDPGVPFLFDWESQANYDTATDLIANLGTAMTCNSGANGTGCGVSGDAMFTALDARLDERFSVTYDVRSFWDTRHFRLYDIAARNIATNAIGLIHFGRYGGSFDREGVFLATSRSGGHVVAVNSVIAVADKIRTLGTRDPWAVGGTDEVQEAFRTNVWRMTRTQVDGSGWNGGNTIDLEVMGDPYNNNTNIRALEGYLAIAPKTGYTWDPYTPATLASYELAPIEWNPGWTPPIVPELDLVTRVVPMPGNVELALEIEGGLFLLHRLTGDLAPIGELPRGPIIDHAVDRFGAVYAAIGDRLAIVSPNGETEVVQLPGLIDALAPADLVGGEGGLTAVPAMHVLMGREEQVATIFRTQQGRGTELVSFPGTEVAPGGRFLVGRDLAMLLDRGALTFYARNGGFTPVKIDGAPSFPMIDAVLDGDALVVVDESGQAHAYRLGTTIEPLPSHPFDGVVTKGRLAIVSSSTNVTPWNNPDTFSTEEDLFRDQDAAESQFDCRADLDADGAVTSADIGLLLGGWGQGGLADIDRDGIVSSSDLGLLLGAFGPCP